MIERQSTLHFARLAQAFFEHPPVHLVEIVRVDPVLRYAFGSYGRARLVRKRSN